MASGSYSSDNLRATLDQRYPEMPEFHQAVEEVIEDLAEYIDQCEGEDGWRVLHYLMEPDRVISFRVNWQDDNGEMRSNRGYRVQANNALGPYKGGLRFTPGVNQSVLQFLAFEQTFKNSLTGLPMGGAKGGADFDPSACSEAEIQRFCRAFMTELAHHIGPDKDIPAGDIGVGTQEIAWLFDQYKSITGQFSGVLTGKHPVFGGSCYREEATGYGCVYFAEKALEELDESLEGKSCLVSGGGNVALHAAQKLIEYGAKVLTLSGRAGTVYVEQGITADELSELKEFREDRGRLSEFAEKKGWPFHKETKPWHFKGELAFACATQNEITEDDADTLVDNGCRMVLEGANMPCTVEALEKLADNNVIVAPSKAVNAGGVAVSGLEISQNRARMSWEPERVDETLKSIMTRIHTTCKKYGGRNGTINYRQGANIAAFVELSKAVKLYGLV